MPFPDRQRAELEGRPASRRAPGARRRRLVGPLLAASLAAASLPTPVPGVAAQQEPTTTFAERVDVSVVSVDVFVTDRRGEWIGGLEPEDFEILEDGRPVEITNFYVVDEQAPTLTAEPEAASPAESRPPAAGDPDPGRLDPAPGRHDALLPEERRRSLVVLIDGAHLDVARRRQLLGEVEQFLDLRLERGDRVVLASLDRTVEVHTSLATDPETVRATLPRLMKAAARGAGGGAERRFLQSRMRRLDPADEGDLIEIEQLRLDIHHYSESQAQELERSLDRLGSFLDSIAGLPGRKALLYVSDGFSRAPGEELFLEWSGRFGGATASPLHEPALRAAADRVQRALDELTEHANRRRVTFYTLSGGLTGGPGGAASQLSAEHGGSLLTGTEYVGARAAFAEQDNQLATVQRLAGGTGGQAILNVNPDTLAEVARDLDRYYSLGFRPSVEDDRDHRIEVRVRHPGLTVRHRPSYRSLTVRARAAEQARAAHLLAEARNPLGASAELGHGRANGKRFDVPMLLKVPVGNVTLLPREGNREGRLAMFIVVHDERGRSSPTAEVPVPIRIPEGSFPEAATQQVGYRVEVQVRPGPQTLTITVFDELGGTTSVLRQPVRVAVDGQVSLAGSSLP